MERAESKSAVEKGLMESSFVKKGWHCHGWVALTTELPSGKMQQIPGIPCRVCDSPWSGQGLYHSQAHVVAPVILLKFKLHDFPCIIEFISFG